MEAMTPAIWIDWDARQSWDQQIILELTADARFHHGERNWFSDGLGAIVVIPGQHYIHEAEWIASRIASLPWALTIVTSDEEALFPVELLPRDEHHTTWGQYHSRPEFERVIPIGTPPGTAETLAQIEADMAFSTQPVGSARRLDRSTDVFFGGQDTHERRHELLAAIKDMAADPQRYGNLTWAATTGFREGLSQDRYLAAMRDTRIAPCPSGPHSLDSFRLYEALAAGALPIVECYTPHRWEAEFWQAMFGSTCPIPIVTAWEKLPDVLDRFADDPGDWRATRDEVREWWAQYRKRLAWDFAETIERLRS